MFDNVPPVIYTHMSIQSEFIPGFLMYRLLLLLATLFIVVGEVFIIGEVFIVVGEIFIIVYCRKFVP